MKKNVAVLFLLAFVVSSVVCFTGCRSDEVTSSQTSGAEGIYTPTTEDQRDDEVCEHILKETVQKEPMHGVNGIKIISCSNCDFFELGEIPALPDVFDAHVNNKTSFVYEDPNTGKKECVVALDFDITNISNDKTIKYIKGDLSILGKNFIFKLECEFDAISISPGETLNMNDLGFSFDYASLPTDIERKVYDAKFEDLTFSFKPWTVTVDS